MDAKWEEDPQIGLSSKISRIIQIVAIRFRFFFLFTFSSHSLSFFIDSMSLPIFCLRFFYFVINEFQINTGIRWEARSCFHLVYTLGCSSFDLANDSHQIVFLWYLSIIILTDFPFYWIHIILNRTSHRIRHDKPCGHFSVNRYLSAYLGCN